MIEQAKAVAQRLREIASKGVSVWGDLQNEGANTIDALVQEVETAHRAMTVYDDAMDRLRAENEKLRLDAARYAALRDSGHLPPDEFDKQIDAAIALGVKHD